MTGRLLDAPAPEANEVRMPGQHEIPETEVWEEIVVGKHDDGTDWISYRMIAAANVPYIREPDARTAR